MLNPDKKRYENGVLICEKIMPDGTRSSRYIASWIPAGGKMKPETYMDPIGVTLHNTKDLVNVNEDSEQYVRATYNENMAGAIVHYYVDDISGWQLLREDESGWHAGDGAGNGNKRTIAIECIMDGTGSAADLKARDNAARLIASIMHRHGWNLSNLYTHNHWMKMPDKIVYGAKKNCPLYILPNYDDFKALVEKYLNALKGVNSSTTTNSTPKLESVTLNTVSYSDIKVGDILQFTGSYQYISSTTLKQLRTLPSKVKVTKKAAKSSRHPIHVRAVNDSGKYISGVHGWVNLSDLKTVQDSNFLVSVTANALNIRKGPGATHKVVGVIEDKGVYTIVEVSNGWGLLKTYRKDRNGWINLSYTKRV